MNGCQALQAALKSTADSLNWYVSDFSDADLLVRPVPNANHAAWQIGNVIGGDALLIPTELPDVKYPALPPGFVLLEMPIAGMPLVVLCVRRAANRGLSVRVATSSDSTDDVLHEILQTESISCVRGSLENVLQLEWFWKPTLPDTHDGEYYHSDSCGKIQPPACKHCGWVYWA